MTHRHYVVWIDADSIAPSNTAHVDAGIKALRKDHACILVASNREAFHASMMGMHVVRFHYYPLGGQFSAAPVYCYEDTQYMELSTPFPWTHTQAVSAARSCIDEASRKSLIPLATAGLI